MPAGTALLLTGLMVISMCFTVSAASKRPGAVWNYYHFDGSAFVAGPASDGSRYLAVRDQTTPVVVDQNARPEPSALPGGKGAVAGICYTQSAGGKLAAGSSYAPAPGVSVTITPLTGGSMTTQTDESGFFVVVLDAGSYTISHGAFSSRAIVEKGSTVLVPLRTGKRMVD